MAPGELWGPTGRQAVVEAQARCGKFMLANNELDADALPAETIPQTYKGQGIGPEQGFRFLKAPFFFADHLFEVVPPHHGPDHGLGPAHLCPGRTQGAQELLARKESLPNQVGKPIQRPTMRRIFQVFEGIDVLLYNAECPTPRDQFDRLASPYPSPSGTGRRKILHHPLVTAEYGLC